MSAIYFLSLCPYLVRIGNATIQKREGERERERKKVSRPSGAHAVKSSHIPHSLSLFQPQSYHRHTYVTNFSHAETELLKHVKENSNLQLASGNATPQLQPIEHTLKQTRKQPNKRHVHDQETRMLQMIKQTLRSSYQSG